MSLLQYGRRVRALGRGRDSSWAREELWLSIQGEEVSTFPSSAGCSNPLHHSAGPGRNPPADRRGAIWTSAAAHASRAHEHSANDNLTQLAARCQQGI